MKSILAALMLLAALAVPARAVTYSESTLTFTGSQTKTVKLTAGYMKPVAERVTVQCTTTGGTLTSVDFAVKLDGAFQAATSGGDPIQITASGGVVQVIDGTKGPFKELQIAVVATGSTACTVGVTQ